MPSNRDIILATRATRRLLLVGLSLSLLLVILFGAREISALTRLTDRLSSSTVARTLVDNILRFGEQRHTALETAVTTADPGWLKRYDEVLRRLQGTLTSARNIDALQQSALLIHIRSQHDRMLAIEHQIVAEIRDSKLSEARAHLDSFIYLTANRTFMRATRHLLQSTQDDLQSSERQIQWEFGLLLVGLLTGIGCIFTGLWRLLNRNLVNLEQGLQATQAEVTRLALYDTLTGLANRRYLTMQLESSIARAARQRGSGLAVLIINLDNFKPINDRYGHQAGDRVLVALGKRLAQGVRKEESVARLGGDEFAVVLESKDQDTPLRAARRLIQILAEPVQFDDVFLPVGASLGIATYPNDGTDSETLLRRADVALYRAKASGRQQFRFFQESMDKEVHDRALLELDLRRAVSAEQIVPFFQPLIDLTTQTLTGFEVLSRWHHPTRGLILPNEFIGIAEDTGQIESMTFALLRKAIKVAVQWDVALSIAINVAPQQLKDDALGQKLQAILDEGNFPAERLEIEITENALIGDMNLAHRVLDSLKQRGIRVALDDFGTGYSSLSHLSELPFDKIKIDRSFIHSMHDRPHSATIVNAIIALGHSLKMDTTAEGIETELDANMLQQLGCGSGQGYLYAKPVPAVQVADLIARFQRASHAGISISPAAIL